MISAERIMGYSHLDSEASLETLPPHKPPPPDWPDKGALTMEDVAFRYSDDLPLVLKNLSFSIKPSEKVRVGPNLCGTHSSSLPHPIQVGIVGRTGAGKSSLVSILFRLAEPFGQILIDGVDTKELGLHDLRRHISIIPQVCTLIWACGHTPPHTVALWLCVSAGPSAVQWHHEAQPGPFR